MARASKSPGDSRDWPNRGAPCPQTTTGCRRDLTKLRKRSYTRHCCHPRDCEALGDWWLAVQSDDSQTPNWDIASTCTWDGHKGLLLVEAKAHTQELKTKDQAGGSLPNRARIAECIKEANAALADQTELDWALSHEASLSNGQPLCLVMEADGTRLSCDPRLLGIPQGRGDAKRERAKLLSTAVPSGKIS